MSPRLFSILLAMLALASPAVADLTLPTTGKRAPIATNADVEALRGQIITIPLTATTASSKDVDFFLQTSPTAGRLLDKEPKRISNTKVTVRYQSDPQGTAPTDTLTYTCRIGDGPVSQAGKINISIVDLVASLQSESITLDLGEVRYGLEGKSEFILKNSGTGPYQGEVVLPEGGWFLPEGTVRRQLNLAAGASQVIDVRFRPAKLGQQRSEISFTGQDLKIGVLAKATCPFLTTAVVFLPYEMGSQVRKSEFSIENPGQDALQISLALTSSEPADPTSLQFPSQVSIPPRSFATVPVTLVKNVTAAYRATLKLTSIGAEHLLTVGADAAPPDVQLGIENELVDGGVEFGELAMQNAGNTTRTLTLRNRGGSEAKIFGIPPRQFLVQGYTPGLLIPPNGEVKLNISIAPGILGNLIEPVSLNYGARTLNFSLRAKVFAGDASGLSFGSPNQTYSLATDPTPITEQTPENIAKRLSNQHFGHIIGDFNFDLSLPTVTELKMDDHTEDSVTISWKPLPGKDWKYTVLSRGMGFLRKPGQAKVSNVELMNTKTITWESVGKKEVEFRDGRAVATLTGVNKGYSGRLAIIATNAEGRSTKLSPPVDAYTYIPPPFNWTKLMVWTTVGLVVAWFYARWRRNRWFNKTYSRDYRINHYDTSPEVLHAPEELEVKSNS